MSIELSESSSDEVDESADDELAVLEVDDEELGRMFCGEELEVNGCTTPIGLLVRVLLRDLDLATVLFPILHRKVMNLGKVNC